MGKFLPQTKSWKMV